MKERKGDGEERGGRERKERKERKRGRGRKGEEGEEGVEGEEGEEGRGRERASKGDGGVVWEGVMVMHYLDRGRKNHNRKINLCWVLWQATDQSLVLHD